MSAPLCGEPYERPNGQLLACHYLAGHTTTRHSWTTCREQDQVSVPHGLIAAICGGQYDEVLEAILAAAHGRKRSIRGERMPYGTPS